MTEQPTTVTTPTYLTVPPLDTIKELHRISGELASITAQEQDDVANGCVCDAYDNIGAALKRLNEKDYAEFQDDTPPNAKGVQMDHNG